MVYALKFRTPKFTDNMGYANSPDPDQTASEGAVWSRPTLFAIQLP